MVVDVIQFVPLICVPPENCSGICPNAETHTATHTATLFFLNCVGSFKCVFCIHYFGLIFLLQRRGLWWSLMLWLLVQGQGYQNQNQTNDVHTTFNNFRQLTFPLREVSYLYIMIIRAPTGLLWGQSTRYIWDGMYCCVYCLWTMNHLSYNQPIKRKLYYVKAPLDIKHGLMQGYINRGTCS